MNINLKQFINILNSESISDNEKESYFNTFFENRLDRISNKIGFRSWHIRRKQIAIINLIDKKVNNQNFFIFYDHYENEPCFSYDEPSQDDEGNTISYDNYCDYYSSCDQCCETIHNDNMCYVNDSHYLCSSCRDDMYYYCGECRDYVPNDDPCGCEDTEDTDDSYLHAYNYRIELLNLGLSSLRYGIELELEVRSDYERYDIVEEINGAMGKNAICKRDGSLDEYLGFELVSTNASFNYHKNYLWNEFFNLELHKKVKGFHGHNTGYHIHFSREPFNEMELKRLNVFYHNPKNRSFLKDIAGRETSYAKFINGIDLTYETKTSGDEYKFRAINFNNENTVEVRIFKSNLKQISFFRNLELVHSINQFILNSSDSVNYTEYFDYLLNNPNKDYVNLLLWLDQKEYFSHLKYIEDFKSRYEAFKNIVDDFKSNNEALIQLESEDN